MKVYPKYKASGVEWIGDIPENWELKTLRRITKEHRQGFYTSEDYIDQGVKLVRITDLHSDGSIDYSEMPFVKITSEHEKLYRIEEGDFLFPRTGTIGSLGFVKSPERAVFASYLIRFRFDANIILNRYLYYYFLSKAFLEGVFSDLHGGVNQNIHAENIKNQFLAHPIDEQQQKIVDFLDYKTGQCDRFIANRQKQIELLNEQKAAIINKAVTKGINPNAKMKPSGIEWIGDIPEHWEVLRLKNLLQVKLKYGANEAAELDAPHLPRYIRITDFGDDGQLRNETFKSLPFYVAKEYFLKDGDILFARSGATVGKTMIFENYSGNACFAGYLIMARCNSKKMLSRFLYFYTKTPSYDNWKKMIFIENTIQNIGADKYSLLPVPVPSIEEQKSILDFIKKETSKIETLIAKYQKQIDLMQEYRTALISQAVTGKIDVRDWQPKTSSQPK